MSRIKRTFAELSRTGRAAFMPFLTAADPDPMTCVQLIHTLQSTGADLLELGIPYSDPLADGPVIQDSFSRVLKAGFHVRDGLNLVASARKTGVTIPILTMVSYSLVYRFGIRRYVQEARTAGVDGLIVPDLAVEESDDLWSACRDAELDLVFLVTPTTEPDREERILQRSSGFLYCVSVVGITGERSLLPQTLADQVTRLKTRTSLPVCVGFGVSRPDQAREVARVADGVIVGSALVRCVGQSSDDVLTRVEGFARELASAVHEPGE